MSILSQGFFKPAKHKQFNYQPRYYNAEKERLDNLKKKYSQDPSQDAELSDIKARMYMEMEALRPKRYTKGLLSRKKMWIYFAIVLVFILIFSR